MYNIDGKIKPMSKVNLDALIPRADFISPGGEGTKQTLQNKLSLGQLLSGSQDYSSIYHLLRKPDFQRETNEWDKKRIADLIESFINRDFIPSIILWENSDTGHIFVIDGAHRLSALLAFINDDYGDRDITHKYYGYDLSPAEVHLAKETRTYIEKRIGKFDTIIKEGGPKANGLKTGTFDLQLIQGDVKRAEDSFFKINQQGIVLSPTEKELCRNRTKPSCIATRIIIKGGGGTNYWSKFEASNQSKIKDISAELNQLLFVPQYKVNIQSVILHHPLGGSSTIATPMIFELLKLKKALKADKFDAGTESDDNTGSETLEYLLWARKLIWKILSGQPGSLGLFPSIYFYNSSNVYIQSAFLGMAQLLAEKDQDSNFLPKFTKVRARLEEFLIEYKVFLTQINAKYGSKERSYRHMKGFFMNLIDILDGNPKINDNQIISELKHKYDFLNSEIKDAEKSRTKKFSTTQKYAIGIKEELRNMARCKICNGHLHPLSRDFDHKKDLKHGGGSEDSNAQTTHYYCNNSKDLLRKLGVYNDPE